MKEFGNSGSRSLRKEAEPDALDITGACLESYIFEIRRCCLCVQWKKRAVGLYGTRLVFSEVGADDAVKEDDKSSEELVLPRSAQVVIHTVRMPVQLFDTFHNGWPDQFLLRFWAWRVSAWRLQSIL